MNTIDLKNEKIIYQGKACINKVDKQIGKWLTLFISLGILGFFALQNYIKINLFFYILIIFIIFILFISLIYGLIHNLFLIKKYKNNQYIITDKRLIIIADNIKEGLIKDINYAQISNEKNNYGNLIFYQADEESFIKMFKSKITFSFMGIENPRNILKQILHLNPCINVFDDKIKWK